MSGRKDTLAHYFYLGIAPSPPPPGSTSLTPRRPSFTASTAVAAARNGLDLVAPCISDFTTE